MVVTLSLATHGLEALPKSAADVGHTCVGPDSAITVLSVVSGKHVSNTSVPPGRRPNAAMSSK